MNFNETSTFPLIYHQPNRLKLCDFFAAMFGYVGKGHFEAKNGEPCGAEDCGNKLWQKSGGKKKLGRNSALGIAGIALPNDWLRTWGHPNHPQLPWSKIPFTKKETPKRFILGP